MKLSKFLPHTEAGKATWAATILGVTVLIMAIFLSGETQGAPYEVPGSKKTVTTAQITDMTVVGVSLAQAGTQAAARAAIGAGSSNFDGTYASLTGKPTLFDGAYSSLSGKPSLFSGAYTDLTGKPTLGTAAATALTDYATAAQGTLAGTAVQPASIASFITTSGARSAISLTTTGTSGASSYSSSTGILNVPVYAAPARSFKNGLTNTSLAVLVTVAAASNGTLVNASRDTLGSYSATITSSSSLTSGASGYVVLEICSTNSATAANWIEVARSGDGQNNALIVGLGLSNVGGGTVVAIIPAGFYGRLRSVNSVGTPVFTLNSSQETAL